MAYGAWLHMHQETLKVIRSQIVNTAISHAMCHAVWHGIDSMAWHGMAWHAATNEAVQQSMDIVVAITESSCACCQWHGAWCMAVLCHIDRQLLGYVNGNLSPWLRTVPEGHVSIGYHCILLN